MKKGMIIPDQIGKAQIEHLQDNLKSLRILAGWSSEQLAHLLGISRVTYTNLEVHKRDMTTTQYIAVRALLEGEASCSQNWVLKYAIDELVDIGRDECGIKETVEAAYKELGRIAGCDSIGNWACKKLKSKILRRIRGCTY